VRGKPDPALGRIVRRDDGTSTVALRRPLPPGRYAWQVERFRDEGEEVASEPRAFRLPGPPLTRLSVKATAKRGTTSGRPGHTTLTIRTTPYVRVTVTLRRGGRVNSLPFPAWSTDGVGRVRVDWTCKATGSPTYRWQVVARDEQGRVQRRSGRFSVVSRATCRAMKAAEDRARAQRIAAEQARLRADAARQAAEERARYQRFVNNCRALGGTPVAIERTYGTTTMCRAPYGGYLSVPS
jgi:hypothetical protein